MTIRAHLRHLSALCLASGLLILCAVAALGTSAIDDANPVASSVASSTPIRGNFAIAKSEISALQAKFPTSTDNALARYDGTAGTLQNSSWWTIADDGAMTATIESDDEVLQMTQNGTGKFLQANGPSSAALYLYGDGSIVTQAHGSAYPALQITQMHATQNAMQIATGTGATSGNYKLTLQGPDASLPGLCLQTFTTSDNPTTCTVQARYTTTDASWRTAQTIATATDAAYLMDTRILGRRTGGSGSAGDMAMYRIESVVKNAGGTVSVLATNTALSYESVAGYNYDVDGATSNFIVKVYGDTTTNMTWHVDTTVYGPLGS